MRGDTHRGVYFFMDTNQGEERLKMIDIKKTGKNLTTLIERIYKNADKNFLILSAAPWLAERVMIIILQPGTNSPRFYSLIL